MVGTALFLVFGALPALAHAKSARLELPPGLDTKGAQALMYACLDEAVSTENSTKIPPLSGHALMPLRGHTTHGFLKWPQSGRYVRGAPHKGITPVVDPEFHPVGTDKVKRDDDVRRNTSDRYVLCLLASGYRWEGDEAAPEQVARTPAGPHVSEPSVSTTLSPVVLEGITACRAGDDERAFALMLTAAEQGDSEAQFRVGVAYRRGRGVGSVDLTVVWLQRAVAQGHLFAGSQLGELYLLGRGVDRNPDRAEPLIRLAADAGYRRAENTLGFMYEYGVGVPIDYVEAVRWYRLSAEQGDMTGQHNLGRMYLSGLGVTRDESEGFRWIARAADQGREPAIGNVAWMLRDGDGITKDLVRARAYCDVLIDRAGATTAQGQNLTHWRDEIVGGLSAEDLERAKQITVELEEKIRLAHSRDDVCQSPELEQTRW